MNFDKAIEVDPDKTYVLECETNLSLEQIQMIAKSWKDATNGGRTPIVLSKGLRLVRNGEKELREAIAEEIEKFRDQANRGVEDSLSKIADPGIATDFLRSNNFVHQAFTTAAEIARNGIGEIGDVQMNWEDLGE